MLLHGLQNRSIVREPDGWLTIRALRDWEGLPHDEHWLDAMAWNTGILRRGFPLTVAYVSGDAYNHSQLQPVDEHYIDHLPSTTLPGASPGAHGLLFDASGADLSVFVRWMVGEECILCCLPDGWDLPRIAQRLGGAPRWEAEVRSVLRGGGLLLFALADGLGFAAQTFDEGVARYFG